MARRKPDVSVTQRVNPSTQVLPRVEFQYVGDESISTAWVNHLVVAHDTDNFFVSFYEILPPKLENPAALHRLPPTDEGNGSVIPVVVRLRSRVVASPAEMANFVRVMQKNLEDYHRAVANMSERGTNEHGT